MDLAAINTAVLLSFPFVTNNVFATNSIDPILIPSSCNDISEYGIYYIKPTEDGPILPVICSDGYTMIDASLDIDMISLPSYLKTYDYGRASMEDIISGLDDSSTFREWWLPSEESTKFRVALDCDTCLPGEFDDNTVYYADSSLYCFSALKTSGCTDINDTTYHENSCHFCDVGMFVNKSNPDPYDWTKCTATHMSADTGIDHDHRSCVAHGLTWHPTLSTIREACTCYQPNTDKETKYYTLSDPDVHDALPVVTMSEHTLNGMRNKHDVFVVDPLMRFEFDDDYANDNAVIDNRDTNLVYIYRDDFTDGTYRIRESGTYLLSQDVVFDFNGPSLKEQAMDGFSPNSIDLDELYWFPTKEQSLDDDLYPGLYSYSGAFTLGFFAGISIECSYVRLDLNGHTLSMSPNFYFQQRFFSIIELASQPFVPGQGTANWGAQWSYASYVTIINGNLGQSSHHGIHGNMNSHVIIDNVDIAHFDVAGIQCNGCTDVLVTDLTVGPQNDDIPVLGRYTHARSMLPRLRQFSLMHGSRTIQFANRDEVTVDDLIDRMVEQMDMVYNHFMSDLEYSESDQEWVAAKTLFLNENGWMDGGSSYGIGFSGIGAQVVGIGARIENTADITVRNVEIFGIYNSAIEKIKFTDSLGDGATRLIFFDAIDWISTSVIDWEDLSGSQYIGDAYTDLTFAIGKLVDSWYFQNSLYLTDAMMEYVLVGSNGMTAMYRSSKGGTFAGQCATDIQLHSNKGSIGLRFDGTQQFLVENVYIHDIYNFADLGSQVWCGQYSGPVVGDEDIEIQYGYTGTRSHAMIADWASGTIDNLKITDVESHNGEANAITIYKECQIQMQNIEIDNINAGTQLSQDDVDELILPNLTPRACGIDIRPNTEVTMLDTSIVTNVDGWHTCYDEDDDANEKSLSRHGRQVLISIVILSIFLFLYVYSTKQIKMARMAKMEMKKDDDEYTPLLIK